ncbi:uncharacterized protein LOC110108097 isoform X1 [Dendrobium catenatum]|uniref:uncharacterized protein LOC110108097 isoform X1 n=1 Tax=Dendrobium catenatum TaxID=906689 RepID=UPI0009F6A535|nr:uncharacterized protein LOC110108097 isoform X1 [Dendrobium catenatum]XP_028550115.1 uncharacterized protein LOC110108097 isoform X1 [Dendrobium catenatum]
MESIIARALEYTLKYWLKSFSRDQFKLQGRTAQLSNLDINGDALHASLGLPLALNVTTARVGKLEITLPAVSYVQTDPIVVQIDRLDLVLEEKSEEDNEWSSSSVQSSTSAAKGSGYGFADKIADGMTLEVRTVNLMLETRGGTRRQGGSAWSSPLAAITIRNLWLYTTNENWEVVNLKEARDFSNNTKFIYVFKKLEWNSLSIDLLPHPDMLSDSQLSSSNGMNGRDNDGAKRVFFGGERFLEGISGQAYITVQRTQQNSPLGLEVQLHITEAVSPAFSEPGLRAFLRFMTGLYVCLNRGDVDPKAQQRSAEAAGRSLVSIIVDHIFLCIKDVDFQLELLMQSLSFSRASVSDGEITKNLTQVMVGGLFLRDTFASPPCTLVQPSMQAVPEESLQIPEFGKNFSPPIYPFGDKQIKFNIDVPLIRLYSLQITPSPSPPTFASQTVIDCQPLSIILQEESCLRISSFLADGVAVNPGTVLPDFSINSLLFTLKELDLTIPLDFKKPVGLYSTREFHSPACFSGARLHVADLYFLQSPSIRCNLLNLDKDPACFSFWDHQPIDASQKKWTTQASLLSLSLETCNSLIAEQTRPANSPTGLWKCVEVHKACFEAAMVTPDGRPLVDVPPPGGVVRIGVSCQGYSSNTSVEQLLFVLDIYAYFGKVSENINKVCKNSNSRSGFLGKKFMEKLPSDTVVSLTVSSLRLMFRESYSLDVQGIPLVQFTGEDFFMKVSHQTLGGAFAVSTSLLWNSVCINCVDDVLPPRRFIGAACEHDLQGDENGFPQMRPVCWIDNRSKNQIHAVPFLDVSILHVVPYKMQDVECHSLNVSAKISGVRLGGGMNYTEALLHRFGILGPDGGPGDSLTKGLENLSSGPLANLFRPSSLMDTSKENTEDPVMLLELGMPDDIDVSIELKNWLFALEGTEEMREGWQYCNGENFTREEMCWHTTFQNLQMKAKRSRRSHSYGTGKLQKAGNHPLELIVVGIEGLQALKPRSGNAHSEVGTLGAISDTGGVNIEAQLVLSDPESAEEAKWTVENIRFSVKQPIEAVVSKDELEHLAALCRSEVDSMGRIAAGILRVLKLEDSIGLATIDQLSHLGSESLDKIFSASDKLSRRSSISNVNFTPTSNAIVGSPNTNLNSTISLLETELQESQEKCSALLSAFGSSLDSSEHVSDIKKLKEQLENMQTLLTRMRTLL